MISYAQNLEDVMIARLFPADHKGFYIDVGAADPFRLSVTKHFYDTGWSGINVEPLPGFFQRLQKERPRDVNVQAMIGSTSGEQKFFEITELPENSTSDTEVMQLLQKQGRTIRTHQVEVIRLADVCKRHVADRQIDFMKIDVEGGELGVLESADWQRFRPILLVIEAVVVNGREETWMAWERVVTEHGYEKVWFDGLNNFYLRHESLILKSHFRLPPNIFDDFVIPRMELLGDKWVELSELVRQIDADRIATQVVVECLSAKLAAVEGDRTAKQMVLDRVVAELEIVDADRAAKQAVVDRLVSENSVIDADRVAKQVVVHRLSTELTAVSADRDAKQVDIDRVVAELTATESGRAAKQMVADRLVSENSVIDADRVAKQVVVHRLSTELTAVSADRDAKQVDIDRVVAELVATESDRAAKQIVADRLVSENFAIDADRIAKQVVIDRLTSELSAVDADRDAKQGVVDQLLLQVDQIKGDLDAQQHVVERLSARIALLEPRQPSH